MIDRIKQTVDLFGQLDPGGHCWPWIIQNYLHLWQRHQEAVRASDLSAMATTYKQMISAWTHRHQGTQGELL